jgi:hypothetical protein
MFVRSAVVATSTDCRICVFDVIVTGCAPALAAPAAAFADALVAAAAFADVLPAAFAVVRAVPVAARPAAVVVLCTCPVTRGTLVATPAPAATVPPTDTCASAGVISAPHSAAIATTVE